MLLPYGFSCLRVSSLLLAALFSLILTGCDALDFEPSGENFQEVPLPTSGISLELGVPGDTLWGWGEVELRYGVALQGKRFAAVEAFWGNQFLGVSTDPSRLRFDSRGIGSGSRPLRLVAYAHSGTGSLADRAGSEFVVAEVTRVLTIDNTRPNPVEGLAAEPHDGLLRLSWAPFARGTFQAYHIYDIPGVGGPPRFRATLTDRDEATWSDPTYLGGSVTYRVTVQAAGQQATRNLAVSASPSLPLTAESIGGGDVRLEWSLGPFYAAVDRVEVRLSRPPGYDSIEATLPGDATSFTHNPGDVFGMTWVYRILLRNVDNQIRESEAAVVRLDRLRGVRDVRYLPAADVIVAGGSGRWLLRLDPETSSEEARILVADSFTPFASPNGARFFTAEQDHIRERDPLTLATTRDVAIPPLLGPNARVQAAWASNDGTVFFTRADTWPGGSTNVSRGVVALDMESGEVRATLPALASVTSVAPSGAYVAVMRNGSPQVVAYDGSSFTLVQTLPGAGFFVDDEHLAIARNASVQVYRFPEMTLLHTFEVPGPVQGGSLSVDPATGRLAFMEGATHVYLRQVDARMGGTHLHLQVAERHTFHTVQNRAVWGAGFYRRLD